MTDMKAVEITEPGGPEQLKAVTRAVPEPGPGEVLIKVAAAGINRPDLLQRQGLYPPPEGASDLPGLEIAGRIVALGDGVDPALEGTAVTALLPGGGYAEYAVADARLCLPVPDGFTPAEAAAMPETFFTVWANVFQDAALQPGERLLVPGGASGIGTTAIMLARAFGAEVFVTAGTDEKVQKLIGFGADRAFNYRTDDWEKAITEAGGVNVVLDMVGGENLPKQLNCLRPGGRHVSIAFLGGIRAEINIMEMMRKRYRISGSTLRARTPDEKAGIAADLREKVWPVVAEHRLKPVIDSTFPLAEAAEAHRRLESGEHFGKVVLTVAEL